MLSDKEAEEIARNRAQGVGGPAVLKWLDQLLADRRERIQQLEQVRKRLGQAFRYLDGLVRDVQRPRDDAAPAAGTRRPTCPKCGKSYARAAGLSPKGTVYFHADRTECRT
jgi:hypothetical protein